MNKKRYRVRLQSDVKFTYKKMKNLINNYGIYRTYNYDKTRKSSVTLEDLKTTNTICREVKE